MAELEAVRLWLSGMAWIFLGLLAVVVVLFAAFVGWALCAVGASEDRMAENLRRRDDAD